MYRCGDGNITWDITNYHHTAMYNRLISLDAIITSPGSHSRRSQCRLHYLPQLSIYNSSSTTTYTAVMDLRQGQGFAGSRQET